MSHCMYNRIASETFILQSQSYKQYFYRKSMDEVLNIPHRCTQSNTYVTARVDGYGKL